MSSGKSDVKKLPPGGAKVKARLELSSDVAVSVSVTVFSTLPRCR